MKRGQPKNQRSESANGYFANVLDDGLYHFVVQSADGSRQPGMLDVLTAKLACERIEQECRLEVRDNVLMPTEEFLGKLAGRLSEMANCQIGPSVAFQIWIGLSQRVAEMQKKTRETRR